MKLGPPQKMWQNRHGNWRHAPNAIPFPGKKAFCWGIIQIFKDGTFKIPIIFRYWWIWLGIQGLFGVSRHWFQREWLTLWSLLAHWHLVRGLSLPTCIPCKMPTSKSQTHHFTRKENSRFCQSPEIPVTYLLSWFIPWRNSRYLNYL